MVPVLQYEFPQINHEEASRGPVGMAAPMDEMSRQRIRSNWNVVTKYHVAVSLLSGKDKLIIVPH